MLKLGKRKVKIIFNAPVILTFVFSAFIATILDFMTSSITTELLFSTYHSSLANPMTWLRFLLHIFGHVDFQHYTNNMMYLLILGPLLEEKYGSVLLLKTIIVTALVTGIINFVFGGNVAVCGASGVVFAFIIMASFTSFKEGEWPLTFILVVVIFLGKQVYEEIFISDNISQITHILGGIIGAIFGYLLNRK